jgi:prolyl oligopeptidase PreP (S9A serine peptidase family)
MTKEKVQNKVQTIQWPKKKYKIKYRQSNDQRKSTKWSTDNPMTKEKVQNKVQRIQWLKKKYQIKYRQSNDQRKITK